MSEEKKKDEKEFDPKKLDIDLSKQLPEEPGVVKSTPGRAYRGACGHYRSCGALVRGTN